MTDLVERLRESAHPEYATTVIVSDTLREAATEIERLRALAPIVREQGFEIERLLAALEEIANMGTGERVRIARRALEQKP